MRLLATCRPSIVVGFGGYPSFPIIFASQIMRFKTIIHEQNSVIGKANKLLSKRAAKVVTSFRNVINLKNSNKVKYIGNPTRYENEYKNIKPANNEIFTMLIFGGSQGASVFSNEILKMICEASNETNLKVFHQGRREDLQKIKNAYDSCDIENDVCEFFENINELYKVSDLVISRAGASSIFELIGFQRPSILIPYKKSINGDQLENAKFMADNKAAIFIDEDDIPEDLISSLINDSPKLKMMMDNLGRLKLENVTQKFADLVLKTLYNEES